VADIISECWPTSFRNSGRLQIGTHGRLQSESSQDAQVNRLLDYLRENLTKQHTVDELATRTAMSRRTFTRHFSKATGMTLVEWLVNERLQRTRELLETTSLPVERISDLVGFQTPVSLRQHFRKRFQVSPRDWRRTFGQGEVGSA
jgi:transcriptional regulator GlxA family with amidase domain